MLALVTLAAPTVAAAQTVLDPADERHRGDADGRPGDADEGSLSEAEVIRLARDRAPASVVAGATEALADARARTAGLHPNPSLSWEREAIPTGPGEVEDVVAASIPIDLIRPRAARSLAGSEGEWMRAEASLARTGAVLDAVLAYYDAVLAQARVEVLAQAVADLDEAARVLARREAAGSASGYESTRLAIAGELGRSHLAEARGALTRAQARLAGLLGLAPASVRVAPGLALMPAGAEAALAHSGGAARAAIRHAQASQRLAAEAQERARWSWLPAIELGGGVKRAGGDYGYVVGVSVNLPIFDRGQALRAEAEARVALSSARADALARTIDADLEVALVSFRAARQELERFDARTAGQVEALLAAAKSGYREGERSIVELLDAQRAQTEVVERRLSLLRTAKRAEARLRAAAGELQ
ncbi:TolC family protein [Haliangium sp.]|uniref:TolC family protein n=1 Tax=Haliangium sp. TaxID=2663208 RepID=UPI003D0F289F